MQGLNKCLERLRKQNDNIIVSKTALEILNTIFRYNTLPSPSPPTCITSSCYTINSNVQLYPDADIYRRVRISSRRFHDKVWQYSDAQQFLARAGWVEVSEVWHNTGSRSRRVLAVVSRLCPPKSFSLLRINMSCYLIHTFCFTHTHTLSLSHTHACTHARTHARTHQIDDFIVLPIGKTVDIPKRILDKHLK